MGYELDGLDSISGRGRNFAYLYSVQSASEAHPIFYPMCIRSFNTED
jgi:hypothetical protein